jgi:hypothetical protein
VSLYAALFRSFDISKALSFILIYTGFNCELARHSANIYLQPRHPNPLIKTFSPYIIYLVFILFRLKLRMGTPM